MMRKSRQIIKVFFKLSLTIVGSYWLVQNTVIENFAIFDTTAVFTYFGVLLGFAITVYTFGLSMTENIKKGILALPKLSETDKIALLQKLVNGFVEIKEDIWAIFYSIVVVIVGSIAKYIENPFGWQVEKLQIPEVLNLALFLFSTYCMFDIMRTLFNLSEINLLLLKDVSNNTIEKQSN
jgi:hypothetical protein